MVLVFIFKRIYNLLMYSTFSNIRESFKLAWKHKMLWILVMLVGGGFSFNASNVSSGIEKSSQKETPQIETNPANKLPSLEGKYNLSPENVVTDNNVNKVLGIAQERVEAMPSVSSLLPKNFNSAAVTIFMLALLVIIFWSIVSFLTSVWASGGLYSGLLKACNSEAYDFKDLGNAGKGNWKRYLKLAIYFIYKRLLSLIPFLIIGGGFATVVVWRLGSVLIGILGVAGLIALVWVLIYNIRLYFVGEFALRSIIADNVPTKATFNLGWKYYKTRPGKSLKLFFALMFVLPIFTLIVFLPTLLLGGITAFLVNQEASFFIIGLIGFLAGVIGLATILVSTPYVRTVSGFSWTHLFLFTKESFEIKPDVDPVAFMYKPEESNGQI
ncbi:MAG: hypothetical protein UU64_C0002G0037 [candidate division WWE3 bacterium GW2011_GWF2_41_45]|uniref:Uncharacterized protein n=3 Tax=Katanobacteria TaxID=422282 RepID=A0A0G0VRX4_UNCKA|nr:MAG: hypothetical protein UU55_C0001G0081 [candidate division WWE3 bacterium GW2011_GWC2_41_23]KKS10635.1 MAG: hypothetical protein UU64_C0002G0037 [candidate division WWE3 bacterium GW2011_GWF2_41_45]KKS12354.1 MAG: hypothetical protein UU68_C0002G0080 [candidate division WWE3 bacterium GW2011_GWF1_41_53]KKS20428.1 MAG: hypothetical protein UU79_C0001G0082 [candidate division WWE3 bacterium GW2011_GWE1_41_72]KKS28595.1 MAG: hypothetical protein UU90_C0023G0031 [candidate division WWE3 bacte